MAASELALYPSLRWWGWWGLPPWQSSLPCARSRRTGGHGIPVPAPGTLRVSKPQSAFPKFCCVARRIRDGAVNNLLQLCQISCLTKRSHFKLCYIKPTNARLQPEWPLALPPSNQHVCFDKGYPGIIPGSENEVAWLHFFPQRAWSTLTPSCPGSGWGSLAKPLQHSNPRISPHGQSVKIWVCCSAQMPAVHVPVLNPSV